MSRRRRWRGCWLGFAVPRGGNGGFFALCQNRAVTSSRRRQKSPSGPHMKEITGLKAPLLTFVFVSFDTLISEVLLLIFFDPLKLQLLLQDCLFATLLFKLRNQSVGARWTPNGRGGGVERTFMGMKAPVESKVPISPSSSSVHHSGRPSLSSSRPSLPARRLPPP